MALSKKVTQRMARKGRIRSTLSGTTARPRLAVFRSSKYIYVQVIDDLKNETVAACSSAEKVIRGKVKSPSSMEAAKVVGMEAANRAKARSVNTVVFDRSGFRYHGRIKAVADGAREGGLKF